MKKEIPTPSSNAYMLRAHRAALPLVWRRARPMLCGLLPGVAAGTVIVSRVDPGWLKLATYAALLPLILKQTAGFRRPVGSERSAAVAFGVLYAVTTISGPPLAVALDNQGLSQQEFRAALGFVRLAESTFTATAYLIAGLFLRDSLVLVPQIATASRRASRSACSQSTPATEHVPARLHEL